MGAVFELLRAEEQRGFVRDDVDLSFGRKVERLSASELDDYVLATGYAFLKCMATPR